MLPPDGPPDPPVFFTDRGLGSRIFPDRLRAAGISVVAMQQHYGATRAENLADEHWISEVVGLGLIVLTKDSNMRFNRLVTSAIVASGARCFAFPRQDITGPAQPVVH